MGSDGRTSADTEPADDDTSDFAASIKESLFGPGNDLFKKDMHIMLRMNGCDNAHQHMVGCIGSTDPLAMPISFEFKALLCETTDRCKVHLLDMSDLIASVTNISTWSSFIQSFLMNDRAQCMLCIYATQNNGHAFSMIRSDLCTWVNAISRDASCIIIYKRRAKCIRAGMSAHDALHEVNSLLAAE